MKQFKIKHDELIARVLAGEKVNTGLFEKNVLEAILDDYIKNIDEEIEEKNAIKFILDFNPDMLESNEYFEEDDYDEEKPKYRLTRALTTKWIIKNIQTISSALGIRPSIHSLQDYLVRSLREVDIHLADMIINLSKEGEIKHGLIEGIAIDKLMDDRIHYNEDYDYNEKDSDFSTIVLHYKNNINFTRDMVEPIYKTLLKIKSYDKFASLRNVSKVPVSPIIVYDIYDDFIKKNNIEDMIKVFETTHIKPEKHFDHITYLVLYFTEKFSERKDFEKLRSQLEKINEMYDFFSNSQIKILQKYLSKHKDLFNEFVSLYQKSEQKLDDDDLNKIFLDIEPRYIIRLSKDTEYVPDNDTFQEIYKKLKFDKFIKISNHFNVAPDEEILKQLCDQAIINTTVTERILNYFIENEIKPLFTDKIVKEVLEPLYKNDILKLNNMGQTNLYNVWKIISLSDNALPENNLDGYFDTHFNKLLHNSYEFGKYFNNMKELYKLNDFTIPDHFYQSYIAVNNNQFCREILSKEKDFTKRDRYKQIYSPLQPVYGRNQSEYQTFSRKIKKSFKSSCDDISKITEENPCSINTVDMMDTNGLSILVELALTQNMMGDAPIDFQTYFNLIGLDLNNGQNYNMTVGRAIEQHMSKNLIKYYEEPNLLEKQMKFIYDNNMLREKFKISPGLYA
ncbi:hypothetical protein ACFL1H_03680 [Nanoarchaeota archaeon]